jgi:hypothetical protein
MKNNEKLDDSDDEPLLITTKTESSGEQVAVNEIDEKMIEKNDAGKSENFEGDTEDEVKFIKKFKF